MLRVCAAIALISATLAAPLCAEPPPSLLSQLSQETEALYDKTRSGLVRVYMPTPDWALNLMSQDFAMKRWDLTLDESVNKRLREDLGKTTAQKYIDNTNKPTTQPTSRPDDARAYRMVPRGDGSFDLVTETGEDRAVMNLGPRSIGILLDREGHVLLPYYIEREAVGDQLLTVACGNGCVCTAKFVGSDRQTMLTVIKLQSPMDSTPMPLAGRRPKDGAMVMFLNVTGEYGRLTLWTGALQDSGVVVSVDGGLTGFLRQGQFLDSARCAPVVEQLISKGKITRPMLGVYVREVFAADPIRRENPRLGTQPGVLVVKVFPTYPAEKAGLREGDIILSIAGEKVGDPPNFAAVMTSLRGETPLQVLRGDQTIDLSVTMKQR